MGIVIENPQVIRRIQRLSSDSGKSAEDLIAQAIDAQFPREGIGDLTGQRRVAALSALREAQSVYGAKRDLRTPDEIIGYDENGLPS